MYASHRASTIDAMSNYDRRATHKPHTPSAERVAPPKLGDFIEISWARNETLHLDRDCTRLERPLERRPQG